MSFFGARVIKILCLNCGCEAWPGLDPLSRPGASFPLSVPIDGAWPDRFPGLTDPSRTNWSGGGRVVIATPRTRETGSSANFSVTVPLVSDVPKRRTAEGALDPVPVREHLSANLGRVPLVIGFKWDKHGDRLAPVGDDVSAPPWPPALCNQSRLGPVVRGHWVAYVSNKKKLDSTSAGCRIEGLQDQPREGKRDITDIDSWREVRGSRACT